MGDYLGNLAAKSLNLIPVVRPRPVSLFEPARMTGTLGAAQQFDAEPFEESAAFDQPKTIEAPTGVPALPQRSIRPRIAGSFTAQALPVDTPNSADGMPQPPGSLARLENRTQQIPLQPRSRLTPVVPPPAQVQPQPDSNDVVSLPASPVESEDRARPFATRPSPHLAPAKAGPQHPAPSSTPSAPVAARAETWESKPIQMISLAPPPSTRENARDDSQRQPAFTPVNERMVIERHVSRDMPRLIPATVATMPRLTSPPDSPPLATDEPTPTIQVTIGRIEVRATPPVQPARKERPAPQVMSLDEYLRQRSHGGGQ